MMNKYKERFFQKVTKTSYCWNWSGAKTLGYGQMKYLGKVHYAPVDEVAFMVRDFDGTQLGFSPDGLVADAGFIEIKTRLPKIHINTIMTGQVPAANLAQLHTGLLVTGREWADYISYSPGMHLWTKRVYPDPVWKAAIIEALLKAEADIQQLVAEYERLTDGLPMTERVELLEDMEIQI